MEKNKVEIIDKEIGNVIEIEESAKIFKFAGIMSVDYEKLEDYIRRKGVRIMNAPYARYVDIDWKAQMKKGWFGNMIELFTRKWHFHVGFAVENELGGEEKIRPAAFEKKKYVEKIHCGSYKNLSKTYREMVQWATSNNFQLEGQSFEFYLNDPGETSASDLKTQLLIPVMKD